VVDLHTHTDRSDGSTAPSELIQQSCALGLEALAIADHDTLAGYDVAAPIAADSGLELICAVELSTRPETARGCKRERSVHILGYFLLGPPTAEFRTWLETQQASRRRRNLDLVARLHELGVEISLADAEVYGRNQVGRPHFARVLLEKGYVCTIQEAFDRYLADDAQAGVERDEPTVEEGIQRIVQAGGLASLAHPVRLPLRGAELASFVQRLMGSGLRGIEVFHSEHTRTFCSDLADMGRHYDLITTGGTDYHGENKPGVKLGTGVDGNISLSYDFLDTMRERMQRNATALGSSH
jgi:3',5'-nucleoside bisphosphate phosphatase